ALATCELYRDAMLRPAQKQNRETDSEPGTVGSGADIESEIAREVTFLDNFRPALKSKTLLIYSIFSRGLAVWVYDDRGVTARWVDENPADLRMLAEEFGELCRRPSSSLESLHAASKQLYNIMIAPVA